MTAVLKTPSPVPGRPAVRYRQFSGVWRPRMVVVTLVGVVLVAFMAVVNISRGDFPIALGDVLAVLLGGGESSQLAAIATASAGPITFVALVVPQVCLRLVGSARPPLLASTVYGAMLLLTSDVIARTMLPVELPVGIITAILGAPYLIWLLGRGNRTAGA